MVRSEVERIRLHQHGYAVGIKPLPMASDFRRLRSFLQSLQWLFHTRPDIECCVNNLTQLMETIFSLESISPAHKIIKPIIKHEKRLLLQRRLKLQGLHIQTYTNGSFADNDDLSSQLGYIALLCDKTGSARILHYSSYKCRRVGRSFLRGEVMVFADGIDFGLAIKLHVKRITRWNLPFEMYTNSNSRFDVITKNTTTSEKRLMVDVVALYARRS